MAKLSVFGRQLLVGRIEQEGWSAARAAEAQGVSRATAYKWTRRYRAEGEDGLLDRTSRPHHSPRTLPAEQVELIVRTRVRRRYGPHRLAPLTGHPRSTISKVLVRAGMSRLRDADRATGVPVRYVHDHPGSLVHQDHKKLGRIPAGGGHRFLGRETGQGNRRGSPSYDTSGRRRRAGHLSPTPTRAPAGPSRGGDVLREHGHCASDRQRRVTGRTAMPAPWPRLAPATSGSGRTGQTNGKAERFIKTLIGEWAYGTFYRSNHERLAALPRWLRFYNHDRPHTALDGRSPMTVLVDNVRGNHT
jgi:transposase